jgi:hypothetical protein
MTIALRDLTVSWTPLVEGFLRRQRAALLAGLTEVKERHRG